VQQLIALRDSVLLAADHTQPMSHKAVTTLARRLGEILELEQVIAFEAEGQFDPMQQQVVDTLDSADPARDRCVALSVRPGYRRAGELLRRQGVVLFKFDEVRSSGPS
jgi:molecular chaperone GrpE (heat shock protein)